MHETREQLNWTAFRYIADEMSEAERSAFESRMLTDQTAREAVAGCVGETQLLYRALATPATPVVMGRDRSSGIGRVVFVLGGSCLALVAAVGLVSSSATRVGGVAVTASEDVNASRAELAYAWARSLDNKADSFYEDTLDAALLSLDEDDAQELTAAPGWMLAAVTNMDRALNDVEHETDLPE